MTKLPETLVTQCALLGRGKNRHNGLVNPATEHGSTYLYPNLKALEAGGKQSMIAGQLSYARHGTATTRQLELAMVELEGGYAAMTTSSGLNAITTALLALVSQGDHILVVDTVFGPTRRFCNTLLKRLGVKTTYYAPELGADIETLLQENTRLILLESPGSLTLEVQDVPSIIEVATKHHITTLMDNTWATPLGFTAISRGINISIHALTKYVGGHSDIVLGMIVTDEPHWQPVRRCFLEIGQSADSDAASLALRGLRTLPLRLEQHASTSLQLANWLAKQPEVTRVFHPARPDGVGHLFWERDFLVGAGLFSFLLAPLAKSKLAALVDHLQYFGLGASWGGYESLILPVDPKPFRTAKPWVEEGQLMRISAGLESASDLLADLQQGFDTMRGCS